VGIWNQIPLHVLKVGTQFITACIRYLISVNVVGIWNQIPLHVLKGGTHAVCRKSIYSGHLELTTTT